MDFAQQADFAKKVEAVIESCTRTKHLPMMVKYVELARKDLEGTSFWCDVWSKYLKKETAIKRKPRYRLVDGEWRNMDEERRNERLADLQDAARGMRRLADNQHYVATFGHSSYNVVLGSGMLGAFKNPQPSGVAVPPE